MRPRTKFPNTVIVEPKMYSILELPILTGVKTTFIQHCGRTGPGKHGQLQNTTGRLLLARLRRRLEQACTCTSAGFIFTPRANPFND